MMGPQVFGKRETLNKRATSGLASHPTAKVEVVLGVIRGRCKLTEPRRVLGFKQSILTFVSPSRRSPYLGRKVIVETLVLGHGGYVLG